MRITATQIIKNVNLTTTQEVVRRIITVAPLGERGFGVPADGNDGEILAKDGTIPFATKWIPNIGGGGGIPDAPNNTNAYVRKGLAWAIGYTKDAIDTLISNFQTASQVHTIADAKVSNEAYNASTWNGITGVAPSKDAVRDKCLEIETSLNGINNNKADKPIIDDTQPTIALLAPSGEIYFADTDFYPDTTELTHVKGVTAPIQGQIDDKQDVLTSTNFGAFANSLTAKNTLIDADEVVSDDSADSSKAKKTSWLNVWNNFIKPKADALYQPLRAVLTNTTASFTTAQETKLSGIATGATANSSDATLLARANHTGTQTASTISDIQSTITNNTQVLANTAKISFDSASSNKLGKYPSTATNGKFLQGNGTNYVEVDPPTASTQGAFTVLANNTASTALPNEQVFRSVAEQAYTGTITWGTTAPTVILNNTHEWQQIGKEVNGRISLSYTNAQTNQQVTIALPPDWPTPKNITGFTSASEVIAFGSGMMFLDRNVLPSSAGRYCLLRRNSANTGYELVVTHGSAISVRNVQLTIQYFT
jgi:hypothetical protein